MAAPFANPVPLEIPREARVFTQELVERCLKTRVARGELEALARRSPRGAVSVPAIAIAGPDEQATRAAP